MFLKNLKKKYLEAKTLAKKNKKKIAFIIGNTIKIEKGSIEIITETSSVINLEEPEKDKMTINEILSEEDIEALFEE